MTTTKMNTTTKAAAQIAVLRAVINQIIIHPENLKINVVPMTRSVSIQIQAHRGDTGRIIGTNCATLKALRKIATAMGEKAGIKILIPELIEPTVGVKDQYPPLTTSKDWPKAKILGLVEDICELAFEGNFKTTIVDGAGKNSCIDVVFDQEQKAETITTIREAFDVLMEAFGNSVGRKFTFDLVADIEEQQPATAAGRYSKET